MRTKTIRIRTRERVEESVIVCRDNALGELASAPPAMGFMAARSTISSPFDMPPSMPPARFVFLKYPSSPPEKISSCTSLPRRDAAAKPSPTSTPLTACTLMSAEARRASSFSG